MTITWQTAWEKLQKNSSFTQREGQQALGHALFANVFDGGQLVSEAPTGTGKSLCALIPAVMAAKTKSQRTILTTETLNLLDQIVDKDLPLLSRIYGGFSFFGLKGRNHYLCISNAGSQHDVVLKVQGRLDGTNGERRDVEKILGYRMDDEDWAEICGDTDNCSDNQCSPTHCYSARAREEALNADIVVTSHKMLQVHGEFIQNGTEGGLLGDFEHIIVDEAHSLEQVVVDGTTLEVAPWDVAIKLNSIGKAVVAAGKFGPEAEELENKVRECIKIILKLKELNVPANINHKEWGRTSMGLAQLYMNTNGNTELEIALDAYDNALPEMCLQIADGYTEFAKGMKKVVINKGGQAKVNRGVSAAGYLASLFWLVSQSVRHPHGTVEAYGTTFALFADGLAGKDMNGRDKRDIVLRAVPLDISGFLRRNLWKYARSVTCISATLRDQTDGSFRFLKKSLGLELGAKELCVSSPFDFAQQQLIYLTPERRDDIADVPGARFSVSELEDMIAATEGRTLVLFTAMSELNYVAELLRDDSSFPYTVLVQEPGADRAELAAQFKSDVNSVLLGSRSFMQGFDVPGEALTSVIMVKFTNPRFDATMKALIRHWRERGFPKFYEMKAMETFVQSFGRGVRSDDCRVVCSLLDYRVASSKESIYSTVRHVIGQSYSQSEITSDLSRVKTWLDETAVVS